MVQPQYTKRGPKPKPLAERFWAKVAVPKDADSCWLWTGKSTPDGYGQLHLPGHNGRLEYAHRFSWALHNGSIPDGIHVLHHCDNPSCVRPDHLFLGTPGDNMRDATLKGRMQRGSGHSQAKLTEAQIRSIRALYSAGGISQARLGTLYGVHPAHISEIITRKKWSHLP